MSIRPVVRCLACGMLLVACTHADRIVRPAVPPADSTPAQDSAVERVAGTPAGWSWWGGNPVAFKVGTQRGKVHSGVAAAYITGTSQTLPPPPAAPRPTAAAEENFGTLQQFFAADAYRGHRLRWSGWLNSSGTANWSAGLWMRIDGPGVVLAFDNMSNRMVTTTSGWERFAVVLDVPANAIGISLGLLTLGAGEVVADDFVLETVDESVPVTNMLSGPEPLGSDSATTVAAYARAPRAPSNLGFEGLADETAAAAAWLANAAVPLASVQPGADLKDLAPLRAMIGTSRLVGMGEGTHGTREFFLMKHRVFEFLVQQMGFTHFAIEATWPEANDINTYVLTGQGDPASLLSHLYFWTWNTQEVLDLILWMRQWNVSAPAGQRVQFLGFDMSAPGAAMDTVASFIGRVDSANAGFVSSRYACLAPYRNHGLQVGQPTTVYAALSGSERAACHQALAEVFALISADSVAYRGASSDAAYANALQSARVVQQFEEMAAASSSTAAASVVRDSCMAENVQWLMQQAGPTAHMMLWAHNGHVDNRPQTMGGLLRSAFGQDYVNIGLLFGTGTFNAVGPLSNGFQGLQAWTASLLPSGSIEALFAATGRPLLLLDARRITADDSVPPMLAGSLLMRSIGAVFDPASEREFFSYEMFPADFQLLIFVQASTPSTLLPFVP